MSDTSKLRWVLYESAYQPALVFPAEELVDTELPPGHTVVYLLGLDSNVVVPDSSVSDYDPHDTAKMSNPAAASGVAMAQQILEGFQSGNDNGGGGNDTLADDTNGEQLHYRHQRTATEDENDLHLLADQDENDEVDGAGGASEDAEVRRRRREEKKLRKEAKRKEKEAKRAAKAALKREREDVTSAPTLSQTTGNRHHQYDSEDDIADDRSALLAAMAIEKKYNISSNKSRGKVKAEKRDEEEEEVEGDGHESSTRTRSKRKPAAEGSWALLEENLFPDEYSDEESGDEENEEGNTGPGQQRRQKRQQQRTLLASNNKNHNRMGQALAALNATSATHDIQDLSGSCPYVHPYLMEIHYEYEQLSQEVANEGLLLTMQKGEVVRAIDEELRQKAAQKAFLEAALTSRQHQHNASLSATANHEIDALYEAITKLDAPLSVAETVKRLVRKQMPIRAAAFDRAAAERAHRAVQRRTRTFQDITVVTLIDHLRSVDAAPREDGPELMRRYIQQRRQHEELKSNLRGLSKTGFYAVPKPLEKWRRARDMMVLANVGAEAQKVLPTSYISQAHSTMLRRMKEHAEKRYDRLAVTARDGASFIDSSSFSGNTAPGGATSLTFAGPSPTLTQQQQRLAAMSGIMQRREAFFQFHSLRCDTEAPVTVETVTLNADFAGTGISQSVLASVDDLTASMAPASTTPGLNNLNGGVNGAGLTEVSVDTDDGMSQTSYSVHSAAPSSYPYIFDSEPRPRRAHRQQRGGGSSVSGGLSSASEGASVVSSRATSVGSVCSERSGNNDNDNKGEAKEVDKGASRRHRHDNKHNNSGAAAAATTSADWRSNAKRSIMEQLTLYCRGRGGKPAILSSDQCREIGRTLLDRAMRAEAERQGASLAVQSNNLAVPFTKTTEQRLKKSVDHYLERRMTQNTLSRAAVTGTKNAAAVNGGGGVLSAGDRNGGVLQMPGEAGVLPYNAATAASAMARQRAVADTPVYEN